MKHFKPIVYLLLVISLLSSSCSLEKRLYTKGYHLSRNKHNSDLPPHTTMNHKTEPNQTIRQKTTENNLTASAEKTNLPSSKNIKALEIEEKPDVLVSHASDATFIDEECDVLVFKTGDEVKAKIFEITPNEIKYKPCDFLDGPMRTVRKSDVFMLKYANGTKEVFSNSNPTPSSNSPSPSSTNPSTQNTPDQSPTNKKPHALAILSFLFSIVGLFIAGIPFGLAAVIFGAVSLKKIGLAPDRFKGKGFAIAAIAIGILDIIGALIAISMI